MTDRRPAPGSAWATHCPDACPREWIQSGKLPDGFTRPASPLEADLICDRMTEAAFLAKTGQSVPPSNSLSKPAKTSTKRKPNPVVVKLLGWNRFLDNLTNLEPRLTPLAVAVWCWLWRCEKEGLARTSERKLAERLGVGRTAIRSRLRELEDTGFLELIRRGKHNHCATVFRVHFRPVTGSKNRPVTGSEIDPLPGLKSPHEHSTT